MTRKISSPARLSGPILLVDDYEDARVCVRDALESSGYRVVEAANGQQALHLLVGALDVRFKLVILDLQMPVMDGWELLELLRRYVSLSKLPVIIVTANEPHLEQVQHPNIFGFLQAPYEIEQLLDMVDDCMTGAQSPGARGVIPSGGTA